MSIFAKPRFSFSDEYDPHLENIIREKDAELKEQANLDGRHLAMLEKPRLHGDSYFHYESKYASGYEELAAYTLQYLQPARRVAEAKMETELAKEKDEQLAEENKKTERQNQNNRYTLGDFHPGPLFRLAYIALLITGIILIGETVFTTQALQITGGSMFSSLLIALSISLSVFLLSHISPLLYKAAKSRRAKKLIVAGTLGLVTVLFTVLAGYRSAMLARHGVSASPLGFIVISLFFFCVSALTSYYCLPSAEEFRNKRAKLRLYRAIQKGEQEIEQRKKQRQELRATLKTKLEQHLKVSHYADYLCKRIRKMHRETVEHLRNVNLAHRNEVPDCAGEPISDIDIDHKVTLVSLKENEQ